MRCARPAALVAQYVDRHRRGDQGEADEIQGGLEAHGPRRSGRASSSTSKLWVAAAALGLDLDLVARLQALDRVRHVVGVADAPAVDLGDHVAGLEAGGGGGAAGRDLLDLGAVAVRALS